MSSTISRDGTRIAFDRFGNGPPVILIHPAYGYRAFDPAMAELAKQLSHHYTVFTYDRRGRGESGDTQPYAIEREIEDIASLISEAGGSPFVYGMSSGAALALEAADRGLPISKLVLYEPPYIIDESRPAYPADYVQHLKRLVSSGRSSDAVLYAMSNAGIPEFVIRQMMIQPIWESFESVAHTLVYDGEIMGETQRGRPLPVRFTNSVQVPTMVIVAAKAPVWARNSAEALVKVLPKGRLQTVEAEFHSVVPQMIAPILDLFFRAQTK